MFGFSGWWWRWTGGWAQYILGSSSARSVCAFLWLKPKQWSCSLYLRHYPHFNCTKEEKKLLNIQIRKLLWRHSKHIFIGISLCRPFHSKYSLRLWFLHAHLNLKKRIISIRKLYKFPLIHCVFYAYFFARKKKTFSPHQFIYETSTRTEHTKRSPCGIFYFL